MSNLTAILLTALACSTACKGSDQKPSQPPAPEATGEPASAERAQAAPPAQEAGSCAEQAGELKSFLAEVHDPSKQVAPPWPTGDAARDERIARLAAEAKALAAPRDPAAPQAPLSQGTTPGELEAELASCEPARAQLRKVGEVGPDRARQTMIELADAIEACDCKVDLPMVRALLYIAERGDGKPADPAAGQAAP